MRILICIPHALETPRGNSVAALRLSAGFERRGHRVSILENCEGRGHSEARECVRSIGPDVVVVMHAWRCATVFHAARSTVNGPMIVSLRGTDSNEMLEDEERRAVIRSVLESSHAIAVLSEPMRKRVVRHLPASQGRIAVIPNGLELPASQADYRQRLAPDRNTFVIVGLAGIREEKRILWLLNALSDARTQNQNLVYLHAGPILEKKTGEMFKEICEKEAWIRYEGIVPREEVASFLRAGDLFVSASRSEGMPHAVREAMFVGRPCLLSDIEGHRNLAEEGVEAVFFNDKESFSRNLTMLMQDSALRRRLAESSRHRVEKELLRQGEIDDYLALFTTIAQNHGMSAHTT
ncbi:MAG TPA: glycosyltransferase [Syntrophorhabdales bacterium]|nr:glycosyltransferase [Syntrophorhabdales bacterium]